MPWRAVPPVRGGASKWENPDTHRTESAAVLRAERDATSQGRASPAASSSKSPVSGVTRRQVVGGSSALLLALGMFMYGIRLCPQKVRSPFGHQRFSVLSRTQHANVIFATKTVILTVVMCSIRSGGLSEASRASHCSRGRAVSGDYHSRFQGGHAVLEIMVGLISLAF